MYWNKVTHNVICYLALLSTEMRLPIL